MVDAGRGPAGRADGEGRARSRSCRAATHSYDYVDPTTRVRQRVTPELAATLSLFAHTLYRPLPAGQPALRDLMTFAMRGLSGDIGTILAMGVVTGALGMISPFLTGEMIDSAIPQGDRGLILTLGFGMLMAAFATAAFKITQSIAVVRIESKVDYTLQSALWDRLLDLPPNFFRTYGAGDLADRAAGINAIRGLRGQRRGGRDPRRPSPRSATSS